MSIIQTIVIVVFLTLFAGCDSANNNEQTEITLRPFDKKVGTRFIPVSIESFKAPTIKEVSFAHNANVDAIWGATGSDDEGNIYFGASTHGGENHTAYLYQYDPKTGSIINQGDVLEQSKRAGLYSNNMGQNKLHSKFYQANDGYLYFSSFDEGGESEGINPTWGGHLWRKLPNSVHWEHVFSTEEALVAVNTNGRYIYALGYWNHVLYQYDIKTKAQIRVVVGSFSKHVSRNFIVDENGHSYVPMLSENDFNELEAYLNEYDTRLNLIGSYPMPSYTAKNMSKHHGIIAYTSMNNGNVLFTTADGGLYQINISEKKEKLINLGNIHPEGSSYTASLFTFAGERFVGGVSRKNNQYQWTLHDLVSNISVNYPLELKGYRDLLLYGSLTKDDQGNFYLGGWVAIPNSKRHRPLLLQLSFN